MSNIYPQMWLALPKAIRNLLAERFEIPRTGVTEIRDQDVVSDGYTGEDLQHITLEKMNAYIGSEETFGRAWEITIAKAHAELNPPIAEIQQVGGEPTIVTIMDAQDIDEIIEDMAADAQIKEEIEESLSPKSEIKFTPEEPKTPWCDSCDSKGVRHKKECPKYVAIERE